jgi:hypothetical protein
MREGVIVGHWNRSNTKIDTTTLQRCKLEVMLIEIA